MKKYLVTIISDPWTREPTKEEIEQMMKDWYAWYDKLRSTNSLADEGSPLGDDGRLISASKISNGVTKYGIRYTMGFMIIQAENIDKAAELAQGCPSASSETSTLEIRECVDMM